MNNYVECFLFRAVLKSELFKGTLKKSLFPLIALSMGCETMVDIDIPMEKPSLVVNSSLETNGWPTVRLTYSKHILDNASGYQQVTNGQVDIQEEDGPWIPLEANNVDGTISFRTLDLFLKEDHTYTYRIQVPGYEQLMLSEHIPKKIPIREVQYNGRRSTQKWDIEQDVTVIFDDPQGNNFYELSIFTYLNVDMGTDSFGNPIEYVVTGNAYFIPKNPAYETDYHSEQTLLFDDKLFDGGEAIMDLLIQGIIMEDDYQGEVYFNLMSVTESYYLYHTTSALQAWNEGDPFAQPVQVFSNIPNGLGIVMGSTLNIFQYK